LKYQSFDEEVEIVRKETLSQNEGLMKTAVDIMRKTRKHQDLRRGSSIRGAIDLVMIMKAVSNPTVQKLVEAAVMALYNKIDAQLKSNRTKEEIVSEIVLSGLDEKALDAPLVLKDDDKLKKKMN
jgi:MoxR-like ATPase